MSKNKKIFYGVLAIVMAIIAISGWRFWSEQTKLVCPRMHPLTCQNDNDCICVDAENPQQGGCFLGNKSYYEKCADKSGTCFDFCTGWGQPSVKCIDSQCTNRYSLGLNKEQIIEKAKAELINKYSLSLEDMAAEADRENTTWYEHVAGNPLILQSEIVKRMSLEGKDYWVVYFGPKVPRPGWDAWVFVEANSGEIIGVILGE